MSDGPPSGGAGRKNKLDAWLGSWPLPEKTAERWEEIALEVERQVSAGKPARSLVNVSDEALVAPPLAEIPGEVQSSVPPDSRREGQGKMGSSTSERQRDRKSLQDLAKLAATTPHPSAAWPKVGSSAPGESKSKEDDSGIVDLKALAPVDPQAEARAQTTPLASVGLFEDDVSAPGADVPAPPAVSARSPLAEPSTSSVNALPGAPASAPASQPRSRKAKEKKKSGAGAWIFASTAVVLAAAAASGLVYVRTKMHRATTVAIAPVAQPALPPAARPQPVAQQLAKGGKDSTAIDPSKLPLADNRPVAPSQPALLAPSTKAKERPEAPPPATAAAPAPEPPPAEAKVAAKPTGSDASLVDQIRQAAGVTANSEPAATSNLYPEVPSGSVPFKPALGAVQGAVGAVLPGARACLGPDDSVAHATVTFRSDGSAQAVGVSGTSGGKDGCIRGALMKARVPPFAQPTFTTSVTVRPN
jgi:hypothetical protein